MWVVAVGLPAPTGNGHPWPPPPGEKTLQTAQITAVLGPTEKTEQLPTPSEPPAQPVRRVRKEGILDHLRPWMTKYIPLVIIISIVLYFTLELAIKCIAIKRIKADMLLLPDGQRVPCESLSL